MTYVHQFGAWWSFNEREWRAWLEKNLPKIRSGEGYTLPDRHRISQRPKYVRKRRGGRCYYPIRPHTRVLQPLDWPVEQWEEEYAGKGD